MYYSIYNSLKSIINLPKSILLSKMRRLQGTENVESLDYKFNIRWRVRKIHLKNTQICEYAF